MDLNKIIETAVRDALKNAFSVGQSNRIYDDMIGRYVIVRSRNEGINAGFLKAADETGCVLEDARRIWYHKPADSAMSWYEGVAISGLSDDSKIAPTVATKVIVEDYSITTCTEIAQKSILEKTPYAQG